MGHVGTINVAVQHKGIESNVTLGKVPNSPLASTPVREYHPPILVTLGPHGGQVKREKINE